MKELAAALRKAADELERPDEAKDLTEVLARAIQAHIEDQEKEDDGDKDTPDVDTETES
jgi:FixJ family two-component response regulator